MAGIAFELRKLIKKNKNFSYVKTYFLSSIVTLGPTIMSILMITFFQTLMIYKGIHIAKRELFMAITMYSFIFSMIITGIFNMAISRYVSDLIYKEEYNKILPSMYGTIAVCVVLDGITALVLSFFIKCSLYEQLLMYLLFVILTVIWIEMIYISAMKDYVSIVRGFAIGVICGIIIGTITVISGFFEVTHCMIFTIVTSFSIIAISFMVTLTKSFVFNEKNNCFEFLKSFIIYKKLIITSLLLTVGIYIHNIIFWFSDIGIKLSQGFRLAPDYDIASFFAFLSVMPSMVMFVVSMETSFYTKFKEFLMVIEHGGSLDDINDAKKEVGKVFIGKFRSLMEVQLLFTLFSLVAGVFILPIIGLTLMAVDIFMTLSLGYYFYICMYIAVLILLYFDDQEGALLITGVFLLTNTVFSGISIFVSEAYYGLGFCLSALMTLVVSYFRLKFYFNKIEYYIFLSGESEQRKDSKVVKMLREFYNVFSKA